MRYKKLYKQMRRYLSGLIIILQSLCTNVT